MTLSLSERSHRGGSADLRERRRADRRAALYLRTHSHTLAPSHTHPLTHPLTHSLTYAHTHSLTHSLTLTHSHTPLGSQAVGALIRANGGALTAEQLAPYVDPEYDYGESTTVTLLLKPQNLKPHDLASLASLVKPHLHPELRLTTLHS